MGRRKRVRRSILSLIEDESEDELAISQAISPCAPKPAVTQTRPVSSTDQDAIANLASSPNTKPNPKPKRAFDFADYESESSGTEQEVARVATTKTNPDVNSKPPLVYDVYALPHSPGRTPRASASPRKLAVTTKPLEATRSVQKKRRRPKPAFVMPESKATETALSSRPASKPEHQLPVSSQMGTAKTHKPTAVQFAPLPSAERELRQQTLPWMRKKAAERVSGEK